MAQALVVKQITTLGANGGTTASLDSTGGSIVWVAVASYASASAPTLTDSKGNTWTPATAYTAPGSHRVQLFYAVNPTVGSGHTFTLSGTGTYCAIGVLVFSGAKTSSPFDAENGASGSSALSTGSVSPAEDDEVLVTAIALDSAASALSVNSGFSTPDIVYFAGGSAYGLGFAYKIQTAKGAENPAWSWTGGSTQVAATSASKAAAAASFNAKPTAIIGAA